MQGISCEENPLSSESVGVRQRGSSPPLLSGVWEVRTGQISKTYSCTAKKAEKISCKGSHGKKKKNQASAFYYTGTVFDMHKLLPTKKVMHNLKARKNFMPQKVTQPSIPQSSGPAKVKQD